VTFTAVGANANGNSGASTRLQDGLWPAGVDSPNEAFFSDSNIFSIQVNLNGYVDISQINTFTRHTNTRSDQRFNLYGTNLEVAPSTNGTTAGWTLITNVDTSLIVPPVGTGASFNGLAGVSLSDTAGSLGVYRHLLLEPVDDGSAAFWSEFDIVGIKLAAPRIDITTPGDPIIVVNGVNDGDADSGPPPGSQGVANAIDNTNAKYLNFLDLGSGLRVTPSFGPSVVTAIQLTTADDNPDRDPASFLLEGSNNGLTFDLIAQGLTNLPLGRNTLGNEIALPGNDEAYTIYRLTFPTLRNAGATNSMQIGEIALLGFTPADFAALNPSIPEPATATLGLMAIGGLMMRRRRMA